MEFCDLRIQRGRIQKNMDQRVLRVLEHTKFILGPEVDELEVKLAEFVGVNSAIAVANGTDALQIALRALDIGPGDEVITPAFSFFATAEACQLVGAKPIFVDIEPETLNLDPTKLKEALTGRTRAILPVSLYGQCADLDKINVIAKSHDIPVIEDAAQSFGALYKGKRSCSHTLIACTSFFPSKPLGCYGDGGAIFTNDQALAKKMKSLRSHGQEKRYVHTQVGTNSRLDTIQAAVLLSKLEIFEEEIELRNLVADRYSKGLEGLVKTPAVEKYNKSVWAQYTIRLSRREQLAEFLKGCEIPTAIHYPLPLHQQPIFAKENSSLRLSVSEAAAKEVLSLPMHPYLTELDQTRVIQAVARFVRES